LEKPCKPCFFIILHIECNRERKQGKSQKFNAKKIIDANWNYVLPGIVDEHVHIQNMGIADIGDFESNSKAAAIGGVTTIMEQPLTVPPTTTLGNFLEKKEAASGKFVVDFALYGGVVPGNTEEIPKMSKRMWLFVFFATRIPTGCLH
jgi:dihydroorotase-like cyclic amidohydrolase